MSDVQSGIKYSVDYISSNETIVLCTHGCKDGLYYDFGLRKFLIDKNNIDIIKNRCIIAISCWTLFTRSIFRTSMNQSKVFLGFQEDFYMASTPCNVPDEQVFVLNMYADILINAIVEVSVTNGTFQDLRDAIKKSAVERSRVRKGIDSVYVGVALSRLTTVDLVGDGTTRLLPEHP
jgi:hypothetical protein